MCFGSGLMYSLTSWGVIVLPPIFLFTMLRSECRYSTNPNPSATPPCSGTIGMSLPFGSLFSSQRLQEQSQIEAVRNPSATQPSSGTTVCRPLLVCPGKRKTKIKHPT